ncbi:hypothetical protein Vadar_033104, partial [Vaccinium darrowii]
DFFPKILVGGGGGYMQSSR